MSDDTPILSLPLILPAQAQKHVTHNEALRILDVLVQLVVADRTRSAPPATSQDGDRHIIGANPTGEWQGRGGWIAAYWAGGWMYIKPDRGWMARVLAEDRTVRYSGTGWAAEDSIGAQGFTTLGVNATADTVNRLTVAAHATLFNHDGAGHQIKLNKAASVDTASLLFQTAFSGRAEMGTAGADDFRIRVSADGTAFSDGAVFSAATGQARFVSGATVPDGSAAAPALAFDADGDTGLFRPTSDTIAFTAAGSERARLTADGYFRLATGTGGIQFGGQSAATQALDAYDEGSFVPAIAGSMMAGTATYTAQAGRFTRIGNRVLFSMHLNWASHDGAGDLRVTGLPVPSAGAAGGAAAVQICQSGLTFASGAQVFARLPAGSGVLELVQAISAGPLQSVGIAPAGTLILTGQYEV